MNIRLLISFFAISFGIYFSTSGSDNPQLLLQSMQRKYPDKMAVYLHYNRDVKFSMVNDSVKVRSRQYYDMLHLNENSNIFSTDKIFTSHFLQVTNLDAKTLIPQKNRYKSLQVENFTTKDEVSDGIFYDDSKATSFVFPGVQPGARTILSYDMEYKDPRFLNSYYFGSMLPVEETVLTLDVDKKIKLNFKLFHCEQIDLEFNKMDLGDSWKYTWKVRKLKDLSIENNAPSISYFSPHIIYYVEEAETDQGKSKRILSGLNDLYNMYYDFVEEINLDSSPQLRTLVDSLTRNADSDQEKIRNIFYWVQDHIKYIAFENGMRGFIPHDAKLVYQKRYGDCKDMASLLQKMLTEAGFKSYFTWIGSRDLPYKYSEVPTPQVDNHMIAAVEINGAYEFLDATSNYTPFGFPSSMIQGKEALIGIDRENFKVVSVPEIKKEMNSTVDTVWLNIDENIIHGTGKMNLTGYSKIFNTYYLNGLTAENEKDVISEMLIKGNNKFFISNYKLNNLYLRDLPTEILYDFKLENYFSRIDQEIYLNLNLDKSFNNQFIELDKRKWPVENEYKYLQRYVTAIKLPEGYNLEDLPADRNYQNDIFGYKIKYNISDDVVYLSKEIFLDHLLISPDYFPEWNKMIESLSEAYRDNIIFKKSS